MADPDWIGSGVEDAWWSWDGKHAYYTRKRDGGNIRDTFSQAIEGGTAARLDGAALAGIDGEQQVIDPRRTRMAFVRNGDIFVRRSEEHTSELQSLMRISYAVFCLTKDKTHARHIQHTQQTIISNNHNNIT